MKCRFCKTETNHLFVDLQNAPPSNSYLTKDQLNEPETYYPLKVFVCPSCFLVQIDEYKKSEDIFNAKYAYFSSFSTTWLSHCEKYVDSITKKFDINENKLVVEVASNDGYLLQYFKKKFINVLGIEPTHNTAKVAIEKGIETIEEFFGENVAKRLTSNGTKADLLIGNNVLAHVPNINDFVKGLKELLNEKGVITIEFPHLLNLIKFKQFDTIYHEHFSYLSLITVKKIFFEFGLDIFDVDEIPTHGGSLRIYAKHIEDTSKEISENVSKLITKETEFGLQDISKYTHFQKEVNDIKKSVLNFFVKAQNEQKKVAAYGAAAKGNTLLNYCGIKKDAISFVVDASPHKQNLFLPGSHIPIVDEKQIKEKKPDYIIIFPWNLKEEILKQLDYISDWNGKLVTFIPRLEILK